MTAQPPKEHCGHECVCWFAHGGMKPDGAFDRPCCIPCKHDTRSRGPIRKDDNTEQCKECIFVGLRGCVYHGYPENAIPPYCSFKIGIHSVLPNVEAQLHNQKQHDAAIAAKVREEVLDKAKAAFFEAGYTNEGGVQRIIASLRSEVKR